MTEREALKLALDYITATNKNSTFWLVPQSELNKTVTAIKEALAQPEQEPVALVYDPITGSITPLQRTWVGLSDAEVKKIVGSDRYTDLLMEVVKFVEAKLKEKNI